jgi:hypothetical protein
MWRIFYRNKAVKADNQRLKQLELDFDALQSKVERMDLHLAKVSGRFHRRFGTGEGDTSPIPTGQMTKEQLRRAVGIIPGRPAPHRQEN